MSKQNIIPAEWLETDLAMKEANCSIRTLQKWSKRGILRFKTVKSGNRRMRLYAAADIQKFREFGPPKSEASSRSNAEVVSKPAPPTRAQTQEIRALDMVSMTGQFLAFMKGQHEAEAQRRKWQLEDAREAEEKRLEAEQKRWEAERQEREAERRRQAETEERERELNKPWLTLKSAVELSGLSRRQILELCEAGTIAALNSGGGWRINRASLVATFDGAPYTRAMAAKAMKAVAR
jgi:hypothetical protein